MNTTPSDQLRAWLQRHAVSRGLTHAQLALRSGLDRSTVSRFLHGDRSPTLDTAVRLMRSVDPDGLPPDLARMLEVTDPETRVERALRDDARLTESHIGDVMRLYRSLGEP